MIGKYPKKIIVFAAISSNINMTAPIDIVTIKEKIRNFKRLFKRRFGSFKDSFIVSEKFFLFSLSGSPPKISKNTISRIMPLKMKTESIMTPIK